MSKRNTRSDLIWSKDLCYEYAVLSLFDPEIKNVTHQRVVMDRFIDFYCFGPVPDSVNVATIVIDAASLVSDAEKKEKLFWREDFYEKSTDPSNIPEPFQDDVTEEEIIPEDILERTTETDNTAESANASGDKEDFYTYSPKPAPDLDKFAANCKEMTQSNPANDLQFYTVRRLICYLGLTLLSAVVKSEKEILSIYSSQNYEMKLYKKVFQYMIKRLPYGPPCKEAISKATEIKGADDVKSLIAKIVLECDRASDSDSEVFSFLSSSFLIYTANSGIEMIHMVHIICKFHGIWFPLLHIMIGRLDSSFFTQMFRMCNFSFTIMESVHNSLDNIQNYFVKHRIDDRTPSFPDFTFNWAAVIAETDIKVLSDLKVEKNVALACILEACLAHSHNDLGIHKRLEEKAKETGDKKTLRELTEAKLLGDPLVKELSINSLRRAGEERRKSRLRRRLRGESVSDSDDSYNS